MLPAEERKLYIESLAPPPGYALDEALCTTYSLSLESLLSIPVNLVLAGLDPTGLGSNGDVWILEAIRRVADKLTVFCDADRIAVPEQSHLLYGLLEPAVVPLRAPRKGAFHPKLWLLRFTPTEGDGPAWMRILVLTRNLTMDRSWDLSLQLEGRIMGAYVAAQRPLGAFVMNMIELASSRPQPIASERRERLATLADEVRRVQLELPPGFDEVAFHALGFGQPSWLPEPSDRLVVVAPFVTSHALEALAGSTKEAVALLSRPEELDQIPSQTLAQFGRVAVLHEAAQSDDGDDDEASKANMLRGLHAKLYIAKRGWNTHVYVGSANASSAAFEGRNVELLVELVGKTSAIANKGIDGFLSDAGMGGLLVDYVVKERDVDPDLAAIESAREKLRQVAAWMEEHGALVRFATESGWCTPTLEVDVSEAFEGVASLRAWLVTTDSVTSSADALPLLRGVSVELPRCAAASTTSFVAFEAISSEHFDVSITFVVALRAIGIPSDRNEQITRMVVNNRDRFMQFISALLAGLGDHGLPLAGAETASSPGGVLRRMMEDGLLERLIRAKTRHPERLDGIRTLVQALEAHPSSAEIIPREFLEVWNLIAEEQS